MVHLSPSRRCFGYSSNPPPTHKCARYLVSFSKPMQRSPRDKDLMHTAQYDSEDCGLTGLSLLHGHASSDFYSAPLASNEAVEKPPRSGFRYLVHARSFF